MVRGFSKNKKRGFSLLEVIIAIGILSVVIVAAYSLLMTGMRVYQMNASAVTGQNSMRMTLMSITRDIRKMGGSDSSDQIIYSVDDVTHNKTLDIGTNISYQFEANSGKIIRTETTITGTGTTQTVKDVATEGITDFVVIKDETKKSEISIQIRGTKVSDAVESKITFRDVF